MSIRIQTEVWKHAPVSGNTLVLLLRLADSAGEQHRMSWESIDTLAMSTRMGRATVFRCLQHLTTLNIIEDVPEDQQPPEAGHYKSIVRRIRPVTDWNNMITETEPSQNETPAKDDNSEVATSDPSQNETRLKMRPNTSTSTSTKLQRETTSLSSPRLRADSNSFKSKRARAEEARAEEDALDPAMVVGLDGPASAQEVRRRSHSQVRRPEPGPDTGMGLVAFWNKEMVSVPGWSSVLGITNQKKLAEAFNRWIDAGASPDMIRAMITGYASTPGFRTEGKTAWIDFLAKRHLLARHADKAEQDRARSENWNEPRYWQKNHGDDDEGDISQYQKPDKQ